MKKSKSALCLVTLAATCAVLASCNMPTKANDGTIFTYTTALGTTVSYTASDLEKSYQLGGKSASTEFDKVYEVLIRKYYEKPEMKASLSVAKTEANRLVAEQQQAAKNAGGNYKEELEKIFDKNNVKNLDELYDHFLYQEEKKNFENKYNNDYLDYIRDGSKGGLTSDDLFMKSSETYGAENKGWIREQVPMNIHHILVKVDAADGEYTQAEISEDNAKKLGLTITRLAGDSGSSGGGIRETFGEIAEAVSDDETSGKAYGELNEPTTKVMSSDLVPEFKLGMYAFETLYNKGYAATTGNEKEYYEKNVASLTPGLKQDATSASDIDTNQELEAGPGEGTTIHDFFAYGEKYDDGTNGIGQIPYGAAKALLESASITTDGSGNTVYEGKATFYPRNILFNKYFNKHNVCVITPNDIAYNTGNKEDADKKDGVVADTYKSLPGFQVNTKNIVALDENVLTDKDGNIVLAVRAGSGSSYQGVHLMVLKRSGLDLNGEFVKQAGTSRENISTLSEYYTMVKPGEEGYPTYGADKKDKDTYVNTNAGKDSSIYTTRQGRITNAVKTYNSALSTYIFQSLIEDGSIKFADETLGKRIRNYSITKRQSTKDDNYQTWVKNWKSYAQKLQRQNSLRDYKLPDDHKGSATQNKAMLSEVCAIGFKDHNDSNWLEGGKCYYVKQ